jgi:hypothetical protein
MSMTISLAAHELDERSDSDVSELRRAARAPWVLRAEVEEEDDLFGDDDDAVEFDDEDLDADDDDDDELADEDLDSELDD